MAAPGHYPFCVPLCSQTGRSSTGHITGRPHHSKPLDPGQRPAHGCPVCVGPAAGCVQEPRSLVHPLASQGGKAGHLCAPVACGQLPGHGHRRLGQQSSRGPPPAQEVSRFICQPPPQGSLSLLVPPPHPASKQDFSARSEPGSQGQRALSGSSFGHPTPGDASGKGCSGLSNSNGTGEKQPL